MTFKLYNSKFKYNFPIMQIMLSVNQN